MKGAVLGAIVGDAFGAPLEGASSSAMPRLVARRIATPSPWSYTDDGAMNIAVAESLVAAGTVDPEHLLHSFSAHYEPARGFGRGMKLALRAFAAGTPWDRCAFAAWPEGSRGNGGAVRITPVACVAWSSPAMFARAVDLTTRVTRARGRFARAEWNSRGMDTEPRSRVSVGAGRARSLREAESSGPA